MSSFERIKLLLSKLFLFLQSKQLFQNILFCNQPAVLKPPSMAAAYFVYFKNYFLSVYGNFYFDDRNKNTTTTNNRQAQWTDKTIKTWRTGLFLSKIVYSLRLKTDRFHFTGQDEGPWRTKYYKWVHLCRHRQPWQVKT